MRIAEIGGILEGIVSEYPGSLQAEQTADIRRIAFHLSILVDYKSADITVCDVGGGVGLFSIGAAAIGMESFLVDDFGDEVNRVHGDAVLTAHRRRGVHIINANATADDLGLAHESVDAITSFHSMEHWHHSPKAAFHRLMNVLKPEGLFLLGVPNCVNLRKRITVPLGVGKWSAMEEWYDQDTFRGHVREPDVSDLQHIARDLCLKDVKIFGRNWLGYQSRYSWVSFFTPAVDRILRSLPVAMLRYIFAWTEVALSRQSSGLTQSLGASGDLGDDAVWVGGPDEGLGPVIVLSEVAVDGG